MHFLCQLDSAVGASHSVFLVSDHGEHGSPKSLLHNAPINGTHRVNLSECAVTALAAQFFDGSLAQLCKHSREEPCQFFFRLTSFSFALFALIVVVSSAPILVGGTSISLFLRVPKKSFQCVPQFFVKCAPLEHVLEHVLEIVNAAVCSEVFVLECILQPGTEYFLLQIFFKFVFKFPRCFPNFLFCLLLIHTGCFCTSEAEILDERAHSIYDQC